MTLTVLVERLGEHSYRASTCQPVALQSEGRSPKEAIDRLREQAGQRLQGSELIQVAIPGAPETSPWSQYAGIWKDHPDFDAFLGNIAEYRQSVDKTSPAP